VRSRTLVVAALAVLLALVATPAVSAAGSHPPRSSAPANPMAQPPAALADLSRLACAGGSGPIKHVVYVQFDNTHLIRDRAGVPSDLEQMPHLLRFMRHNGTLLSNDHTVLISHTADGIVTSLTGVYADRHGQPVANSFRYFKPDGTTGTGVSFAYWTDGIFDPGSSQPTDTSYNMLTPKGKNAPAPWVPYTRAGCDWGAVGMANTVLENTGPDVTKIFGAGSPEEQEAQTDPHRAQADFVGVAIHCAKSGTVCDRSGHGRPDVLPDEPGGYRGFNGLFGAKYVDPVVSPHGPMRDLDGDVIADPAGNRGFPGFDGLSAKVSLSWVAAMQEHGVPVTFAYISDAHDLHIPNEEADTFTNQAQGPGEKGYVAQLRAYDQAFATFFHRLRGDGLTPQNTLYVFTVEEGDHFVGGRPSNPNCDGVTTPCRWSHVECATDCPRNAVGEINVNLRGLLATEQSDGTAFDVHSDMAPAYYLHGNPPRGAPETRSFERHVAALTATNPYTGRTDRLTDRMVDRVGMRTLHMITGDPLRTPTFVDFMNPNYFGFAAAPDCASPCSQVEPGFAWNHGGMVPEIAKTWVGFAGPGVRRLGQTGHVWTDHTDYRPTMLLLLGLKDDYVHDGRVITQIVERRVLPDALRSPRVARLGALYKQLNAPFGAVGLAAIDVSTAAIQGSDSTYRRLERALARFTTRRDRIAARIRAFLDHAAFGGGSAKAAGAGTLVREGRSLLRGVHALAGDR
jgi:hypothetical protein